MHATSNNSFPPPSICWLLCKGLIRLCMVYASGLGVGRGWGVPLFDSFYKTEQGQRLFPSSVPLTLLTLLYLLSYRCSVASFAFIYISMTVLSFFRYFHASCSSVLAYLIQSYTPPVASLGTTIIQLTPEPSRFIKQELGSISYHSFIGRFWYNLPFVTYLPLSTFPSSVASS